MKKNLSGIVFGAVLFNFFAPTVFAATGSAWDVTTNDDEDAADHSANIANYGYYPHKGHLLITPSTTFTLNDQSASSSTNTDAPTGDNNVSSSSATLALQYGLIMDGLRIGITENELFSTVTSHTSGTGVTSVSQSSGLSDPTVTTYFRYLKDSDHSPVAADLDVSFSPSLVTHDVSSSTSDGSNGKGYGDVTLTLPFFWWAQAGNLENEVEFSPAAQRQFSGNGVGTTTSASYTRSSQWVYTATLGDRFHLTPEFFIQGSALLNFPTNVTDNYLDSASHVGTTQTPFYVAPSLELGYRFFRSVVFEAAYTYNNYTSASASSSTKNINDTLAMRFLIEI